MVVQIPVENALKHGLAGIDGLKLLGISVCRKGSGILIDICDNGRGYSPQTLSSTRGTGTGLKVLYQTIQLLNDKNREKIRFEIKNLVNNGQTGTQVLIYIPLDYSCLLYTSAPDSLSYYYLLSFYSKSYFVTADFDSVLYLSLIHI